MSGPAPARGGDGCWGCAGSPQGKVRSGEGGTGVHKPVGCSYNLCASREGFLHPSDPFVPSSPSGMAAVAAEVALVTLVVLGQPLEGGPAVFWWGLDPAQTCLGGFSPCPELAGCVSVPQIQHPPCRGPPEGRAGSRAGTSHSLGMEPASSAWLVSKTPRTPKPLQPIPAALSSTDTTGPIPEAACRYPSVCSSAALFPEGKSPWAEHLSFCTGMGQERRGKEPGSWLILLPSLWMPGLWG